MIKALLRQPLFVIGFLFVFALVIASFFYTAVYHDKVPQLLLLYDKNGNVLAKSPLTPSQHPLFGTDKQGYDLTRQLLIGAKYTILGASVIALIRILMSFVCGVIYGSYLYRFKRFFTGIVDAFHVIPLTLLAYLMLRTVLLMNGGTSEFAYSLTTRLVFEVLVLAVIAVPVVGVLIGNEIGNVLQNEYIQCAKILGGSRWHILFRHVMPHLLPRLVIIFIQQIIQVMIVMVHLGLLELFFGGTMIMQSLTGTEVFSFSNEWSGLIGNSRMYLDIYPWLLFGPLVLFTITIIAFSFMVEGLNKAIAWHKIQRIKRESSPVEAGDASINDQADPFAFVRQDASA
ncbi:ABC transporter permease [Camelliibacillus cellulosilyticus]|uniref:ABC transporter permease n=1 Tax=Camelliibacillus cellulosilyticus TaxID=2174486 RepID=A0ABV9GJA0_9BACL